MIRLVVTGKAGQVATALLERTPASGGAEVVALGRPQLDLEKPEEVQAALASARPDVIVNAAAYTAVDQAENDEKRAMAINRDGAQAVAMAAHSLGVPLLHLSTDYVYDGRKGTPYVEGDPTNPLNVYGRTKLAGERAVAVASPDALILRTAWVYSPFGSNFVRTMLRLAVERNMLRVVDDQIGNPTSALDLADALLQIAIKLKRSSGGGLLHLVGSSSATWFRLAEEIFRINAENGRTSPELVAITSAEYPTPAQRPSDTRLATTALQDRFDLQLPSWQEVSSTSS